MDFFKSVFSDDPDPPRFDPDPESPKKPSQSEEDDAPDAKPDPNPNPSAGGGWSFGGLIKTLTTKSESVIEIYRRDLQEFGTGLKHETAAFREVASRVVKELPASIEVGASEFGSSMLKGTAEIISHGKEALLAVDTDTDENAQNHSNQGVISKPFSRFDAQVRAIQNDVNTYVEEPEDLDDYNKWKLEFVLDDKGEEIQNLLEENGAMEGIYNRIVPKNVDQETFWFRYFYRVYKLKQAEDVRASLVKRAIMREDEEELSWDVEDEDEDDETTREVGGKNSEKMEKENRELGNKDYEKIVKKEESVEESGVGTSAVSLEKGENEVKVDAGDKGILTMSSENVSVSDEKMQLEVKKDELAVKSDEKVALERKVDSGESSKESSVQVVASQAPEEEDLGWDEIEDLSSSDEKKVNLGSPANRDNVRKRLSAADKKRKEEEEKKRRKMDWRIMGLDSSMLSALHDMIDMYEEPKTQQPSRAYVRDHKAMNATQADVKEYPNSYVFLVDMPGLKPDQIKVQIEEPNMLVVFGERKHEKEKDEKEGVKFLRMERRLGKFLKTFMLPENANPEAISAVYQDGVLTVTVEKKPLPEPKKAKSIEVKVGG